MKRIYGLLIVLLFFTTTVYAQVLLVHNRTIGSNYTSITNALKEASNGDLIEVDIGTYNEYIDLSNFTNLTLQATAWTQSGDNSNTILDGGFTISSIIKIENGSQNKIIGFTIKKASQYGVDITGTSVLNEIRNNQIYSNDNYGVCINSDTADNNYILANNIWGINQTNGINIINADNNIIRSNQIHNNEFDGIYIDGNATNNYVVRNTIYSNDNSGVCIFNANNNYILTNNIWGSNQNYGIYINNGDNNIIILNQIHNNQFYGICFRENTTGNYIVRNTIYSNDDGGVYIYFNANNNYILTNNIWGEDQDGGIYIENGANNIIRSNQIHNNQFYGICFTGYAKNNYIVRNTIYSNEYYGVIMNSISADNNFILTNTIWGENQDYGIYISCGDNNKIYRNLIKNNENYGIYLDMAATNIEIINNTIYGSVNDDGVYWDNSSSGIILNNIILSNGSGSGDYGIQTDPYSSVYIAYNDIYGNWAGATEGNIVWGAGNITNNPMIDTVNTFEITNENSPCVDSGINVPGVTDNYNGNGPDMGWKESLFGTDTTPPVTTASKDSGFYSGEIEVVLTANDPETPDNIQIYYTTDGSNPKSSATVKSGLSPVTIKINTTTTLKFYAKNSIGLEEEVKTRTYTFEKVPMEDVAIYNNHLDLSKGEPAKIIFERQEVLR